MLRAVEAGAAVVVCSTCRFSASTREDEGGQRGGALLAEALRTVQRDETDRAGIMVQEMPCLFACKSHCVIHIRAPGKVGYVLGSFEPGRDAARAILEYASHYVASEEGVVRYADWPEGVKGHFITRTPPEGYLCT